MNVVVVCGVRLKKLVMVWWLEVWKRRSLSVEFDRMVWLVFIVVKFLSFWLIIIL